MNSLQIIRILLVYYRQTHGSSCLALLAAALLDSLEGGIFIRDNGVGQIFAHVAMVTLFSQEVEYIDSCLDRELVHESSLRCHYVNMPLRYAMDMRARYLQERY